LLLRWHNACAGTRAELALRRSDPAQALQLANQLIASAGQPTRITACLPGLRGEALAALGRFEEAEAAFLVALRAADMQGARPLSWRIHAALARLYRAQSRRLDASSSSAAAQRIADEIATQIPDPELRATFLQRASAQIPRGGALTLSRAAGAIDAQAQHDDLFYQRRDERREALQRG
jgi:tetratricopeptide (TPR) repeat protein